MDARGIIKGKILFGVFVLLSSMMTIVMVIINQKIGLKKSNIRSISYKDPHEFTEHPPFLSEPYLNYKLVKLPTPGLYDKPVHDIFYNTSGFNTDRSVFVVPRRAYFVNRTVLGEQRKMILIIAEINHEALNSISGCEMNDQLARNVNVINENSFTGWVRSHHKECTHRIVVVECVGFPRQAIINGSATKLIYKKKGEDFYSRVETEKPLHFSSRSQFSTTTHGKGSIFACSALYNHPGRLHDWLKYQKTLGVDFVHLNVDASFSVNATEIYPFLNESLHNGFVKMEVWNDIVGERMFYHSQIVKYQDCLYRYLGVFEYGIFYDVDDFFNPMLPDHKDIHYYFNREFSKPKIGSIYFEWLQMLCGPDSKLHKTLSDGNVTSILSGYELRHPTRNRKCAHRLNATVFVKIHRVERNLPGYAVAMVNTTVAYIAHNRITNIKSC